MPVRSKSDWISTKYLNRDSHVSAHDRTALPRGIKNKDGMQHMWIYTHTDHRAKDLKRHKNQDSYVWISMGQSKDGYT